MNFLKTNPAGIDIPINSYQGWFYTQMKTRFGINSGNDPQDSAFDLYGRAHNNPKENGSVPEVLIYDANGKGEYVDVLFNDKKTVGQGFWVTGDRVEYQRGAGRAKVALILEYTMTGITGAEYNPMHDEQVNRDIMSLVHRPRFGFTFTGLVKRIDNIFKEYPMWRETVRFTDMYPWHTLRLEFDLLYNIDAQFNCKN